MAGTGDERHEILLRGDLRAVGRIRSASNATYLCEATLWDTALACVYKPVAGEQPLWDFPDGTLADRELGAYLISAAILYLPANLLPVMITRSLLGTQQDTILSGVIYFWVSGAYGLAALIFVASFLVPLFKLSALFLLAWTAQRGSDWRQHERAGLYRMLEVIGRWSMLDVFVVVLLVGMVRFGVLASVEPEPGLLAFGAVVVATMLASSAFDPRLIWPQASDDERD